MLLELNHSVLPDAPYPFGKNWDSFYLWLFSIKWSCFCMNLKEGWSRNSMYYRLFILQDIPEMEN